MEVVCGHASSSSGLIITACRNGSWKRPTCSGFAGTEELLSLVHDLSMGRRSARKGRGSTRLRPRRSGPANRRLVLPGITRDPDMAGPTAEQRIASRSEWRRGLRGAPRRWSAPLASAGYSLRQRWWELQSPSGVVPKIQPRFCAARAQRPSSRSRRRFRRQRSAAPSQPSATPGLQAQFGRIAVIASTPNLVLCCDRSGGARLCSAVPGQKPCASLDALSIPEIRPLLRAPPNWRATRCSSGPF